MPYDYNTPVLDVDTHTLTLNSGTQHTLDLNDPGPPQTVVLGNSENTFTVEITAPIIGRYWSKEELIPITAEEIDIITGNSSALGEG